MFNKDGITKQSYGSRVQILANVEMQAAVGCRVAVALGKVDGTGRKIVKAGTPVKGDLSALTTAFTAADTDAAGVLLHDVDVTKGDGNATLLLFGFVNLNRLESDTKALITEDVKTALKGQVTFVAV